MLAPSFHDHLKNSNDLVTTYEEIRSEFVSQALEKSRLATPFVEEARSLKIAASKASSPNELLYIKTIQPALLVAAGVSDKSESHIPDEAKKDAVKGLIEKYLEPSGQNFVEELVFRFLLTRGDTLGGAMRNKIGRLAQFKLTRSIIAYLSNAGISYYWLPNGSKKWNKAPKDDASIELSLNGISWSSNSHTRTIIYNRMPKFFDKNIDICLIDCDYQEVPTAFNKPELYLALGELKGGIDPAGADEHWKTANTALTRIRENFRDKRLKPRLFFIGAIIVESMANEIWELLEEGKLDNAANLTKPDQIASLCSWLCNL